MSEKRTFDRLINFDSRSRDFPIRTMVAGKKPRSYTWACNTWLDQGREGACTGFAVAHEAAARPCVVPNITNAVAKKLYKRAQQLDQWPGEAYEGSSVLGAMKAATELGWFEEYRWAFNEADLALAVGYRGPAVLGINWYEGMSNPDSNGIIRPTGKQTGGHAILCRGYNAKTRLYRLRNSWGPSYGIGGDCFISADDLEWLLHNQGEACIPVIRSR